MGRHIGHTAALAVLVALGVSACVAGDDAATESADTEMPAEMVGGDGAETGDGGEPTLGEATADDAAATPPGQATGGSRAPSAPLDLDGIGRSIAVVAGVTIATSNIRNAVDDTLEVVRRNGAGVFDAAVNIGNERDDGTVDGSGRIVVKVPPAELDALIADLDGTAGTLIGRTQQSEDVTDQLVDLDIRIRVEQQTIAQFERLLAEATEFQDIVTIQSVITEHTIVLEQLLARERNVEQRVELSTLTIDLVYRAPQLPGDDPVLADDDGIADAFGSGWDAFVGVLFAAGLVLAVSAPFLALAVAVLGVVWLIARRRPARRRASRVDDQPLDGEGLFRSDDDQLVGPNPQG